jgi:hypothetical protein
MLPSLVIRHDDVNMVMAVNTHLRKHTSEAPRLNLQPFSFNTIISKSQQKPILVRCSGKLQQRMWLLKISRTLTKK